MKSATVGQFGVGANSVSSCPSKRHSPFLRKSSKPFSALAARGATSYNFRMIRSFRHKGVERFFKSGSRAGIQAAHAPRLARQLSALDAVTRPEDMNRPGWDWHPLKGGLSGHWSVSVNGNWRLTFAFENGDAILVDYQDYH
jgi:proteic killer suppression protein